MAILERPLFLQLSVTWPLDRHSDQSKIGIAAIIDCKTVIFLQTGMTWAVFK